MINKKELAEIKEIQKKIRDIRKKKLIIVIDWNYIQIRGRDMPKVAGIHLWRCACHKKEGTPYNHYTTTRDGVSIIAVTRRSKKEI